MNYEKPQRGNPHQLTVNQHCFPASCIKRFVGNDGRVQLTQLHQTEIISAKKPCAKIFCAKRAWDERAEHVFMKEIEDKYKTLADKVVSHTGIKLNSNEQAIITDMFALWNIRAHWKDQPVQDQYIEGAMVAVEYTKDKQEELEKHGITANRPNFSIPGRSLTGNSIQLNLFKVREQMSDAHWGILKSVKGEFIVPDQSPNSRMLPLTPNLCFFSQSDNDEIDEVELAKINACSISGSKEYYFARDLSKCLK